MRTQEIEDIIIMALEMLMMGVLCTILVLLTITSRNLYVTREKQENNKDELTRISEEYFFEHSEHILGTDVINFILRNNVEYDYYFTFRDGTAFEITGEVVEDLHDAGEDFTYLWSQDYLTNTIFRDTVYQDFDVEKRKLEDGRTEFYILEKGS